MKPWQERYADKRITASEAAALVKCGDVVRFSFGRPPLTILEALAARAVELEDVKLIQCFSGSAHDPCNDARLDRSFRHIVDGVGPDRRNAARQPVVDVLPVDYPHCGKQFEEGRTNNFAADVFFAVVSPPDARGFSSFGNALWYSKDVARNANLVVAEVDPTLIRTYGDNFFHVSGIDHLVEKAAPPADRAPPGTIAPAGAIDMIAGFAASLIRDGDTLQMGAGEICDAVGRFLTGRTDLGIHSEIMSPSHVELVKRGVATGKRKTLHTGRAVAAMVAAEADLQYVNDNPLFELYSVLYTNRISVIAAQRCQVAVNGATAIDLVGQAAGEWIGRPMRGGIGPQLAFAIGALSSEGGRSILVLASTAHGGAVSRIVPFLEPGSTVATPREYADYVVTEFGIANLQGKTQRQRADSLIALAHPDFRPQLRREASRLL